MKNSLLLVEAVFCILIRVYLTCQIAFWVKNFFNSFYLLSYYIFSMLMFILYLTFSGFSLGLPFLVLADVLSHIDSQYF